MDYSTANKIMAEIHLRRDWTIVWWHINDRLMRVEIRGVVDDSGDYPKYAKKSIAHVEFYIDLMSIDTPMDLANLIMSNLIKAATHEEREFFRIGPLWVAPFHPHTTIGQKNWAERERIFTTA